MDTPAYGFTGGNGVIIPRDESTTGQQFSELARNEPLHTHTKYYSKTEGCLKET